MMVKNAETYWRKNRNWYDIDENYKVSIRDDAPPEAKESFKRYMKRAKEIDQKYGHER